MYKHTQTVSAHVPSKVQAYANLYSIVLAPRIIIGILSKCPFDIFVCVCALQTTTSVFGKAPFDLFDVCALRTTAGVLRKAPFDVLACVCFANHRRRS